MNIAEMKFHDAVLDLLDQKPWFNNLLHEERDELLSIITNIYSNHKNVISNNIDEYIYKIERLRAAGDALIKVINSHPHLLLLDSVDSALRAWEKLDG